MLRSTARRAAGVAAAYTRAHITLAGTVPAEVVCTTTAIPEERMQEISAEQTGEIAMDELLGDDEPEEESVTPSGITNDEIVAITRRKELLHEREAALQAMATLSLTSRQTLIANLALRRLADKGDPAAYDLTHRNHEFIAPQSRVVRALLLPLSLLALTTHPVKG